MTALTTAFCHLLTMLIAALVLIILAKTYMSGGALTMYFEFSNIELAAMALGMCYCGLRSTYLLIYGDSSNERAENKS